MSRSIELRAILNRTPLGPFRWRVVLSCWLIAMLDGFDVQSMAFVAPALAPLWQIPKAVMGQVLTAGVMFNVGGVLGAIALGRAADKLGAIRTLGCAYLLAALTVWLLARADGSWVLVIIALAGAGVMGAQFCVTAVATTFYPTQIGSTGVGAALGFGRVGSLAGPLLGGWALGAGMQPAQIFALLAVPMLACGLATLPLSGAFGPRRVVEQPGVA